MKTTTKNNRYEATYHADGTATVWNVYTGQWVRGVLFEARVLAALPLHERDRVIQHTREARMDLLRPRPACTE